MVSSTGGSHEELPARLDSLLSSAIREKARDERALVEMFGGMRQDIEAFGKDLLSIKKLVQRPFQPILTLLDAKLAEMESLVSDFRDQVSQRLKAAAELQNDRVAQESKTLGTFIADWSKYLDMRLKEEGAALRKLVADSADLADAQLSREATEIKHGLAASAEKIVQKLERHTQTSAANLTALADQLLSQMTMAEDALRADVEVAQEALLEGIGESSEAVYEVLNEVTSVVQKQIAQSLAEGLRPFSEQTERLGNRIDEAGRQIADATGRLQAIQESLIGYLAERDERLEHARDQALIDLVERMSDAVKGRAKTKIVDALREGDKRRKDERDAARYREANQNKDQSSEYGLFPPAKGQPGGSEATGEQSLGDLPNGLTEGQSIVEGEPWLSDPK